MVASRAHGQEIVHLHNLAGSGTRALRPIAELAKTVVAPAVRGAIGRHRACVVPPGAHGLEWRLTGHGARRRGSHGSPAPQLAQGVGPQQYTARSVVTPQA